MNIEVVIPLSIVLCIAGGDYLIARYFRAKENFVDRLNAKVLKGTNNGQN